MNYNITINEFKGPLDLLLHLVRSSKMDIYEINIHEIINQYLSFLKDMEEKNIDVASDYLVMASELVHLKSKLLINRTEEDEETDEFSITSEEDLKEKILAYEKIKGITSSFKELEEKRNEVYTKIPDNLKEYAEAKTLPKGEITINDLYEALLSFQERLKYTKPLNTKITKKELSVEERTNAIRDILKKTKKINFIDLFENPTKDFIVVTFLSILNMSKNNEIRIDQENNFSPITIESV